jgi:flagellin-like hook-associated protein FlgL
MPTEPITLSTSIRQNLLSLQNTTKLLDLTSNKLSTGLKVNSSLDNPASFFAARSLTNRASDLSVRKDGIGQAISLLQSTDKSITALTSLVEQAKAKATEANEAATGGIRTISSEKATSVTGFTTISTSFAAAELVGATTLSEAAAVALVDDADIDIAVNGVTTAVTVSTTITAAQLVTKLSAIAGITASLNSTTDQIDITANGGTDVVITEAASTGLAKLGGFKADGVVVVSAATLISATRNNDTDLIEDAFGVTDDDVLTIAVTGGGTGTFTAESGDALLATASTIADLVTAINAADTALTASYNTTTSKIDIKAAEGVTVTFTDTINTPIDKLTLNDGTNNIISGTAATYSILGTTTEVGALTTDFQTLLDQINGLINDASYKGTNLLKASSTLDVVFNATGDSKLTVIGKALEKDTNGILAGLKFTQKDTDYDFTTAGDITSALNDVDAAITELRSVASTFGTTLGIMQTREDFTNELVGALNSGAAKLVNANLEEESAKLLALQTRQAIGVQSLAIANTSQQSILALFR